MVVKIRDARRLRTRPFIGADLAQDQSGSVGPGYSFGGDPAFRAQPGHHQDREPGSAAGVFCRAPVRPCSGVCRRLALVSGPTAPASSPGFGCSRSIRRQPLPVFRFSRRSSRWRSGLHSCKNRSRRCWRWVRCWWASASSWSTGRDGNRPRSCRRLPPKFEPGRARPDRSLKFVQVCRETARPLAERAVFFGGVPGAPCWQRQARKSSQLQKYGLIELKKYDSLMRLSAGTLDVVATSRCKNRRGRQVTGDYTKMPAHGIAALSDSAGGAPIAVLVAIN